MSSDVQDLLIFFRKQQSAFEKILKKQLIKLGKGGKRPALYSSFQVKTYGSFLARELMSAAKELLLRHDEECYTCFVIENTMRCRKVI